MADNGTLSPMLQQYWQIRREFDDPNTILFFRLGDFYEMFFEDAEVASQLLDITLTSRNRNDPHPIPLCGVPYHSAAGYIAKLLEQGKKVAICEQVEDPKTAKGVVRREVTRLITPGAVLTEDALPARDSNYLAAICGEEHRYGLVLLDISTGEFRATQVQSIKALADELSRLEVREVVHPRTWDVAPIESVLQGRAVTPLDPAQFDAGQVPAIVGMARVTTECPAALPAVGAAWAYLSYIRRGANDLRAHIGEITTYRTADYLILDEVAKRNLELTRTMAEGSRRGSLLWLLDRTATPMGARKLKQWLLFPLLDRPQIVARLDAVQQLADDVAMLQRVEAALKRVGDLERITGRIVAGEAHARDCTALRASLAELPGLVTALAASKGLLRAAHEGIDPLTDVQHDIAATLVDDPPLAIKDGGVIRTGAIPELDELRQLQQEGKGFIARLEATERERTGIASLKVRYNKVFGYYIEITHAHKDKIPPDYIRKQTLTNAERYITPELKTYEEKVLTAEERIRAIEYEAFCALRVRLAAAADRLKRTASFVAVIDVLASFADLAQTYHYCRPVLTDDPVLRIIDGRHPVIEQLAIERFIPNDCCMNTDGDPMLVITGPNMAGKSTVMRQVALIVILAQMGSFVPAAEATIGLTDRIFTRVGATDNLARGHSTFMVEMSEAATILHEATARSLIVIDEIGRGTSTYDGVAIAWAIAEYLHDHVTARTLFATHFHELADLALTKTGVRNYTMAVKEWNDQIIFLRKLIPGAVNRSYGIQVAKLAGLPDAAIDRAKEVLGNLERGELNEVGQPSFAKHRAAPTDVGQLTLFHNPKGEAVLTALADLQLDTMTPLEALNTLHRLKAIEP